MYHLALYEMQDESFSMVPAKERPTPEELETYTQRYPDEPSYGGVRMQRAWWLYDHRRESEEKRGENDGRAPLGGHEPLQRGGISGFDPETFSIDQVVRQVRSH